MRDIKLNELTHEVELVDMEYGKDIVLGDNSALVHLMGDFVYMQDDKSGAYIRKVRANEMRRGEVHDMSRR